MGRHRRSAAGRATTDHAAEVTHPHLSGTASGPRPRTDDRAPMGIAPYLNPEAYAETNARSTAYLFATDDERGPADDAGAGPGTGGMPTAEATNGGPAPAGGAGGEFATAGGAGGEFAMAGAPAEGPPRPAAQAATSPRRIPHAAGSALQMAHAADSPHPAPYAAGSTRRTVYLATSPRPTA